MINFNEYFQRKVLKCNATFLGSLLHHEANSDLEFTLSSLAACKAGAHVRKRHLRRLIEITNAKQSVGKICLFQIFKAHSLMMVFQYNCSQTISFHKSTAEVLSKAILALQCVERDHRNRNVKPLLKKPLTALSMLQEPDGGFGSLHTTAIATQVHFARILIVLKTENNFMRYYTFNLLVFQALQEGKAIWNRTSAVSWLLTHQGPDGAFFDVPTTAEVIIALANTGVNSLKDDNCEEQVNKSMYDINQNYCIRF